MGLTTSDTVLWAIGFVLHLALLGVLAGRARWRNFPVFTSLIAYQALATAVLFLIRRYGSSDAYYFGYWILALGDYSFQVAVIFEIARNVLRSTGTWVEAARRGFLAWALAGTLVAAGLCLTIDPPGTKGLDLWEMRATLFTSLLTCELFLSMSAAANRLGLPWRSHVMALGQGLTGWAAVAVIGDVVHVATGWHSNFLIFDRLRMYVYLGVLLFWMVSFWTPERKQVTFPAGMQEDILALHRRVQYSLDRIKVKEEPPT